MYFKQLEDSVYQRKIFLFVGTRAEFVQHVKERWNKNLAKEIGKDTVGQMGYFSIPSEVYVGVLSRVYYLWSLKFANTPRDIGTLAHESFHMASTILCDLGVTVTDPNGSEAVAYYMESVFQQCLCFLFEEERRR